ncbi:MAG: hypothetical protein PHY44_01680 [Lachnospiraceae bacterium]|nr:hypothetical protein [Lachnospiraceae bacterium]
MTEKEFAEKIWEKSFSTVVIEYPKHPKNKKVVDTIIKINLVCLTKMVKPIYRKYRESIPTMEDMNNEFQALFYFASLQFAVGKSEEELSTVLDDFDIFNHPITKQYYNYIDIHIRGKLYDVYVRNKKELKISETLIGNFELDYDEFEKSNQKDTYYDMHINNIKDYYSKENNKMRWLPEVLLWYWCNREDILTKSKIEFIDNLNRNLANDVYGRPNVKHYKERIKSRLLIKFEEYQIKYGLKESKVA